MAHKASFSVDFEKSDMTIFDGIYHFWTITRGVGWGYDNNWYDVLLIQFLLNSIRKANLAVDGIFGKKTQEAIRSFQANSRGVLVVDGKVNAVDGSTGWIEDSSFVYTIYALNAQYLKKKPIYYEDLTMDPKLPIDLCQVFGS